MKTWRCGKGWFGKLVFGAALGWNATHGALQAQETAPQRPVQAWVTNLAQASDKQAPITQPAAAGTSFTCNGAATCDPCAPAWCDPVSRVPNFFGSFVARGIRAVRPGTQLLTFAGGGEGFASGPDEFGITALSGDPFLVVNGPGGPYNLTTDILGIDINDTFPIIPADENTELTGLIQANFPGATYRDGAMDFDEFPREFVLNYLFDTGLNIAVNLPNPSGGGLVGRNRYFDNGSPMPHDRVYFFHNRVNDFRGLGRRFNINRYVFGAEKTFLDNTCSIELRVPFAGTANSDQGTGGLSVSHTEFGNVGVALKAVLYRTSCFLVSAGLGLSAPTADDSRLIIGGQPALAIENRTWLIQPMLGAIYAPNDRCYAQFGVQCDIDPAGNLVRADLTGNGLTRIGVLHDQGYLYASGAAGYWVYQGGCGHLTGVALQGEVNYDRTLGDRDSVRSNNITVSDRTSDINVLNGSAGAIFEFGSRTYLSFAVSFPLTGNDRLYDWNAIAQLNYRFGGRR